MSEIRCEKNGAVATVTLSNPGKLNALDVAMWQSLRSTFDALSADTALRCIVIRGEGGNFAAGADIAEFATVRSNMADGMRYHTETIARALHAISTCLHPTVAAIEGVCVGGGLEIACACDIRIASPSSRFGIPINRLGFPLAPGELQGLLDLVGKAATLEILLEGRVFDAAEAHAKGLLHRIAGDVPEEARQSAQRIARGAPLAARMNKKLIQRLSVAAEPLSEQELAEAFAFLQSQDYKEGVSSFLQKTPPQFTGQ
ncbi:enoyl-CoA hydratase/isomerase family protein [Undibacterium sp. TJN25]|uniref:enoyl-CoA hydratase/isomerase family protein n=1 Tax=Undibacterium sp. TJN25 TaxID=3413056 RepID=UPI003BF2E6A2